MSCCIIYPDKPLELPDVPEHSNARVLEFRGTLLATRLQVYVPLGVLKL